MTQIKALRPLLHFKYAAALGLLLFVAAPGARAYSVLSHEAIIDSTWDSGIKPLLLKRFPKSTPDEVLQAHAYAYGGCVIQDLGYYPFGSKFFSDLTHYVRGGEFIMNLIRGSEDLNEYAFALGALSHYAADMTGHPKAVNITVPILYPKLEAKFGKVVTYADDATSHGNTEFAFDVFQAARNRYAPAAYKAFVGFEVAKPLLERAFEKTYGLRLKSILLNLDLNVGSYRRAIGTVLPAITRVAWQLRKQEIRRDEPSLTRKTFLYNLSRSSYEKDWGNTYEKPGIRSKILAFVLRILPKVGPLKALSFKRLTPETERLYMASFNATILRYRELLAEQSAGRLKVPNGNLDVGRLTIAGKYRLADAAYSRLLHKLESHYTEIPDDLRKDIIAFYHDLEKPISTKAKQAEWDRLLQELDHLRAVDADMDLGSQRAAGGSESVGTPTSDR